MLIHVAVHSVQLRVVLFRLSAVTHGSALLWHWLLMFSQNCSIRLSIMVTWPLYFAISRVTITVATAIDSIDESRIKVHRRAFLACAFLFIRLPLFETAFTCILRSVYPWLLAALWFCDPLSFSYSGDGREVSVWEYPGLFSDALIPLETSTGTKS